MRVKCLNGAHRNTVRSMRDLDQKMRRKSIPKARFSYAPSNWICRSLTGFSANSLPDSLSIGVFLFKTPVQIGVPQRCKERFIDRPVSITRLISDSMEINHDCRAK